MPKIEVIKAVDARVNLNLPVSWKKAGTRPFLRDKESLDTSGSHLRYLFPGINEREGQGATPKEMISLMDEASIEKGIMTITPENEEAVLKVIAQYPKRFVGNFTVNPHEGMEAVRKLEKAVKTYPFIKAAKVSAHTIQKPYNDKIYYPVYAKCVELDIPITANVGIPAARVPGECLNPIYLDEVCWFFPELKVVMNHGGEPWQFMCVKLMLKWPNLYYMTSAFAPKHYPPEIVQYLNTRGEDKVMFATDYPTLPWDRCMKEVRDLPLREHVWPKFLRENAMKVFKLE